MGDQSEIRGSRSQWFAGKAVAVLMRVVGLTLRYRIEDPHGQKAKAAPGVPVIWIFWHNCLFSAPLTKKRFSGSAPASALASASKDGAVLESVRRSYYPGAFRAYIKLAAQKLGSFSHSEAFQ